MVVYKKRKNKKMRAETTHGYGAMKKHRGAGNRGGKGMAGSGKRADQKKPSIIKQFGLSTYFGKRGFKRPQGIKADVTVTNLDFLDAHLEQYLAKGQVTKEGDSFVVDLEKLGFQKLLGRGKLTHKIKISAPSLSASAIKKIEEAGGQITNQNVDSE